MPDEEELVVMCLPEHALARGYCSWGVRNWFKHHSAPGITLEAFTSGGIPSDKLMAVDDYMAQEIAKEALAWAVKDQ